MNETANHCGGDTVKEVVVKMVHDSWAAYGRALMLARLGQELTRMGFDLKSELKGDKLATFIERELRTKVTLLTLPSDPLVKGIVPIDAALIDDKTVYFSKPDSTSIGRASEQANFDRNIWLAFSRVIQPGYIRTISLKPIVQVLDVPIGADVTNQYLVPEDLIVTNNSLSKYERVDNISKNIHLWATRNKVNIDQIKASLEDSKTAHRKTGSVLSILLGSLDEGELRRVSLPLDIVEKLQNKQLKYS